MQKNHSKVAKQASALLIALASIFLITACGGGASEDAVLSDSAEAAKKLEVEKANAAKKEEDEKRECKTSKEGKKNNDKETGDNDDDDDKNELDDNCPSSPSSTLTPSAAAIAGKPSYSACISCHGATPQSKYGGNAANTLAAIASNKGNMGFLSANIGSAEAANIAAYVANPF
jgi:hypothetical protein